MSLVANLEALTSRSWLGRSLVGMAKDSAVNQVEHENEPWALDKSLLEESEDRLPLALCWAIWGGLSVSCWFVIISLFS